MDVLANDEATNPFPETPLRVVDIRGLGRRSLPDGVSVTPSADNSRLARLGARIGGARRHHACSTRSQTRPMIRLAMVWGNVTISVQDVPDPVANFRVAEFGDRTLKLAWTPGAVQQLADHRVPGDRCRTPATA